ncbi:MAG: hypothetical protein U1E65_26330 [Myxococcota bacterium]
MKPDGRSLDIVVIGLGQAGGNIATEFNRRGYPALALNTANSDLSALDPGGVYPALPAERRLYIGMDGYDGAGADPEYGSQCVDEHAQQIRQMVLEHATDADAIILSAGLGGGTGSSLSALVRVLGELELPLIGLMTLPGDGESGIVKVNAVRAINEMVEMPLLGWIFVDNQRLSELNQDVSIVDYFAHVNGRIASPIDALNRLNNRDDIKSIRSFDGEDLRKLLLSGGVLNYGVADLPGIRVEEVVGALRDGLEESDLMPAGYDMGAVSYLGIVIEAGDRALAETPIATFDRIDEQIKRETGGAAVYRGIYKSSDSNKAPTLRYMAACQSLPHRIREILADAKKEGGAIRDKLQVELPSLELGDVERMELFRPGAKNRLSERPKKTPSAAPGPIEDLRMDIMRPRRPAQSPQVKRNALQHKIRPPTPIPNSVPPPPPPPPVPPPDRASLAPEAQAGALPKPKRVVVLQAAPPGLATKSAAPLPKPPPPADTKPIIDGKISGEAAKNAIDARAAPVQKRMTMPLEISESSLMEEASPESITHEIDIELQRRKERESRAMPSVSAPPPMPPPEEDGLPSPETYDKMVADFLHSKDDDIRDDIADRLELDSQSEHTVIRYYAVEAMSKLGREVFGGALLSATEDENEAVRAIAVEALRR